jgi:hypothetical protein
MKPKKSKFSFGPGGIKGFFLEHVEKMVLGAVLVLVLAFVYFGSTVETLPQSKTPASLQQAVETAKTRMLTPTWAKVKEKELPPSIDNPIVINTKPDDFQLVTFNERIQPVRTKRRDPNIFAPIKPEAYAVTAPVAMVPVEEEIMPIDAAYLAMLERQQQPVEQPVPEPDTKKKKKKKPAGHDDPLEGVMTRGMGGNAVNGPRQLGEEERAELQAMQARVSNNAVARSRNIISFSALLPYKKQLLEYQDALGGKDFKEERDVPTYVFIKVQRADVTNNPTADPKTLTWQTLSITVARNLPYVTKAEWESIPEELVDPNVVLTASERFGVQTMLTLPVPPVLLTDMKKLAGHSEIGWANALLGQGVAGQANPEVKAVAPVEGPDAPEGPDGPDNEPGGRPGINEGVRPGFRPGGPGPGGPIMPREGRRGMGGGGASFNPNEEVTYKLIRWVDFDVQRGHQYRYRTCVMLEDPNHPQVDKRAGAGGGVGIGREGPSANGNDPLPSSLDKTVEQRLRELKKDEDKTGKRKWYRETEWSEPTAVVTAPDPVTYVGGTVTSGREQQVPGTGAFVATTEPIGKTLVVKWDDALATNVVAQDDVQRGSVLNFTKDAEALHPIKLEYVELKDYSMKTDGLVVDVRGGERLPGGDSKNVLHAPGEMALIDEKGRLVVMSEYDDIKLWHRYGKVEPKKVEEPEPEVPAIIEPTRPPKSGRRNR